MHAAAQESTARAMSDARLSATLPAAQLVRQATGGDREAFEELIRRLQRRVYGFAYQHLRDADEAHDLAQEIIVKFYRNLSRYDAERPFDPRHQVPPPPRPRTARQLARRGKESGRDKMNAAPLACARVRVLLESYVDGDLARDDAPLAAEMREHLAGCADCRRQHHQAV